MKEYFNKTIYNLSGNLTKVKEHSLLHNKFLTNVDFYTNRIALTIEDREWTYGEIGVKAQHWASALLNNLGYIPERIGVFGYRSEVSYIGVLASLIAGAAFVPLNRNFPKQRTQLMIKQADLDAIIVDKESFKQLCEIVQDLDILPNCILLPDLDCEEDVNNLTNIIDYSKLKEIPINKNFPIVSDDSIAYILFTSGSTGTPKGVPISHANVVHFIEVNQERYKFEPTDRFTQTFDQTFDLSIFDLFMAWSCGGTVCSMQPIELLSPFRFIKEKGVTVWFSVPSIANLLRKQNILQSNSLPTLKWSLFCGESLTMEIAQLWQEAAPNSTVENLYGPTELTIACTAYRWHPDVSPTECLNGIVPIGRPYSGLEAILLNDTLNVEEASNKVGELCIAGPQTFGGYWRDSKKTSEKIIELCSLSGIKKSFFRTGDLVETLPNGNLIYHGRMDQQIKVQGYRIELSEIEGVLSKEPGIIQAAAVGWPMENRMPKGITAFIVMENEESFDAKFLIAKLRYKLPSYMVPHTIHLLDYMPLNVNGKIDRKALLQTLASK